MGRIYEFLTNIRWIYQVARRPTRSEYGLAARLTLLLSIAAGGYSFVFQIVGTLVNSPMTVLSIGYPRNIVVFLAIFLVLMGLFIYIIISLRRGMGQSGR